MEKLFDSKKFSGSPKQPKIWAVASGKGGVGKTFVSTSLGITLTKLGYTVVIADLDPTGANVHTALGHKPSELNLRHWVEQSRALPELLTPTNVPKLSFIQGFWDNWTAFTWTPEQLNALTLQLRDLKADFVIADLGPGAAESQLALFNAADEKILVTTPEPTSIEKTYRFLEGHICSVLKDDAQPDSFQKLAESLRDYRNNKPKRLFSFRDHLREQPGFNVNHFEALSKSPVRLVLNHSRSQSNSDLGFSMKSVCQKYYDFRLDFVGSIDFDNAVWQSVKNHEPALIAQPFTPLAGQFLSISKHLIDHDELRAVG